MGKRSDVEQILLDEMRLLRTDVGIIKDQVVKTNGRVNRAEEDIFEMKSTLRTTTGRVTKLETEEFLQEKADDKSRWDKEYWQKWGPIAISAVTALVMLAVAIRSWGLP